MYRPVMITVRLASPLAGEPPRLDALLEYLAAPFHRDGVPGHKVDRSSPAPPQGVIPISMKRERLGDWYKPCCSDPILPRTEADGTEHISRRFAVEHARILAPTERKVVVTRNSWTKSYRLPLRVRSVSCVKWFANADAKGVRRLLKHCCFIGKKIADGYGRVSEWLVEEADEDLSWLAPTEHGPMLMATLPDGPWLPEELIGARRDFGACVAPYWHPERYGEIVVPC